jgi:orotidine-5'-phosphate decarboxylase
VFTRTLHERVIELDTRVCLGIDPRPGLHAGAASPDSAAEAVAEYFEHVLDATHDLIACCKPQSAFFEAMGLAGIEALERLMARARSLGVPVLLDAKRGDIATTAEAYAAAYLGDGRLAADALTINGYLGMDSLEPFITRATVTGRGVFVLLKTSNPGSVDIQDLDLASGVKLYQHLAGLLRTRAASLPSDPHGYTPLGVVVGATHATHLAELRHALPSSVILVPGYGAQGGSAADVAAAFDAAGAGAVVSASRSLTYPGGMSAVVADAASGSAARAATLTMRDDINRALARR